MDVLRGGRLDLSIRHLVVGLTSQLRATDSPYNHRGLRNVLCCGCLGHHRHDHYRAQFLVRIVADDGGSIFVDMAAAIAAGNVLAVLVVVDLLAQMLQSTAASL